jgi:hypothetical protein
MQYSLMRKLRLSFIDSDILYKGVLQDRFDYPYFSTPTIEWFIKGLSTIHYNQSKYYIKQL